MKLAILGSDGFVGRNLLEDLSAEFNCFGSSRRPEKLNNDNIFFFNLKEEESWEVLKEIKPDCIINCIVGGAIKKDSDVKEAIDLNYLQTLSFYKFLEAHLPNTYLVHFGTAFEYNLDVTELTEKTECLPKTYYGISKYLISRYLLSQQGIKNFSIIRPFNLFGPYDQTSKIIPCLITAQKEKVPVALSGGLQKRDYLFVKDLSKLVTGLIKTDGSAKNRIINAGSGKSLSIKEIAASLSGKFPEFDSTLWQWGKLPYREGESLAFFNSSDLAKQCGMTITDFDKAFEITADYYLGREISI